MYSGTDMNTTTAAYASSLRQNAMQETGLSSWESAMKFMKLPKSCIPNAGTVGIPETGAILRKYILIPTIIMRNPTPGRMIRTIQIQKNQHSSGVSLPGHLFPSVLFMHTASRKALLEEAGDRRGRAPRTALTCRKPSSCVLPAYNERAITVRVIVSAGSPVIGTIAGRGKNVTVKGPWNKSQHRARARMREFMPRKPLTGT